MSKRKNHESAFHKALTQCLAEVQRETSAGLAVVLRASSGQYHDVALLFGAGIAWLGMLFLLVIPTEIHPYNLLIDVPLFFLIGAWVCNKTRLRRWFTSRRRRRRQVKHSAEAAFVDLGVLHARDRTGLLIYWSRLERQIEVVADTGILATLPAEEWHHFLFAIRRLPLRGHSGHHLLEQIRRLGKLLARHLPPQEGPRPTLSMPTGGGK